MSVKKVWVEDGCILCGLCETNCGDIFTMGTEKAEIKKGSNLNQNEDCIKKAAEECPVTVIKFE
jgi:ferredoxin